MLIWVLVGLIVAWFVGMTIYGFATDKGYKGRSKQSSGSYDPQEGDDPASFWGM